MFEGYIQPIDGFIRYFVVLLLAALFGCKDVSSSPPHTLQQSTVTDAQLYHLGLTTTKTAFYKYSNDTIPGNSGGAHAGKILVWYNAHAATQLDTEGKVKPNPVFPDSSLIVKQIFNSNNTTAAYAFLFKLRNATNAGANGWIWSELDGNGVPLISANDKGAGCSGCHATGTGSNFDYTRMNDAHP